MNNLFQEKELLQSKVLSSTVQQDSITKEITTAFDFEFDFGIAASFIYIQFLCEKRISLTKGEIYFITKNV